MPVSGVVPLPGASSMAVGALSSRMTSWKPGVVPAPVVSVWLRTVWKSWFQLTVVEPPVPRTDPTVLMPCT